ALPIFDVPSSAPGLDYIEPGDSDSSYLINKIEGTQDDIDGGGGGQMPLGGVMPPEEIALIRDFIDNTLAPVVNEGATVELSNDAALGTILTDGEGNTLYMFSNDIPDSGVSACQGACVPNWPAFYTEEIEVGSGLNADDFGSIDRGDGEFQTTYLGYPLYTFANDNAPGDTNGEGVGDIWYTVAVPFYDALILNTTN
ncbi:MAG: hypothetical protein AAFX99_37240, partial [Myxococcota bacterium]